MTKEKIPPQHKDMLGNDILVDDYVAFPSYNSLMIGRVVKINPKMIKVVKIGNKWNWSINKYPVDIVKLPPEMVTFYVLSH